LAAPHDREFTTMGRSYGVYGDRFAGTGRKHSLRCDSWLTVVADGVKTAVRWWEFENGLNGTDRAKVACALEFDGVFHAEAFTVRVGRV
jgi:hypothetical protein